MIMIFNVKCRAVQWGDDWYWWRFRIGGRVHRILKI
jgi:hypothetical protein